METAGRELLASTSGGLSKASRRSTASMADSRSVFSPNAPHESMAVRTAISREAAARSDSPAKLHLCGLWLSDLQLLSRQQLVLRERLRRRLAATRDRQRIRRRFSRWSGDRKSVV